MTHSGIKDAGARFQIIPSTRKITVPVAYKVIGTVGDHLSEQLTFQCPKLIDGHDIKACTDKYVTWMNPNGDVGHDKLHLIGEDNEDLLFTWDVRGSTTVKAGVVSFSIHFEDHSEGGSIAYRWSTAECKECEILDAVNAAVGVYELIYIDGDTLVIADYTPVRDETIVLETNGVVPSGNKVIDTNGHHDVATLASVDVAVPRDNPITLELQDGGLMVASDGGNTTITHQLETPKITASTGKITATANGLTSEENILAAEYVKRTRVNITHQGLGYVSYEDLDLGTNAMITNTINVAERESPLELKCISGSQLYFTTVTNKGASVTVEGYATAVLGTLVTKLGIEQTVTSVPTVEDGTVVNIVM